MLKVFLYAAVGIVGVVVPADAHAADVVRLSGGSEAACKAIAAKPGSEPRALVIDVTTATPDSTAGLLAALDDLRRQNGISVAVCPRSAAGIRDGAALAALACDAIVFVKGAEITGAEAAWCTSASRREDLAAKLASLGRIAPPLAARFLDSTPYLSWSAKSGFAEDDSGSTKLAEAGKPIQLGAPQLKRIGIEATEADSVDAALAAIEAGTIKARKAAGVAPTGAGATSVPKPSDAAAPAVNEAKLRERAAEYATTLGELKGLLREFDDYYRGLKGRWTSENKGLKWVWDDKSDHTEHKDTKMTCQRLQRDIKTKMSALESCTKTVERIVKDRENPDLVRMKSNLAALDGLRAAFERNKVSNYETFYPQVMALK